MGRRGTLPPRNELRGIRYPCAPTGAVISGGYLFEGFGAMRFLTGFILGFQAIMSGLSEAQIIVKYGVISNERFSTF